MSKPLAVVLTVLMTITAMRMISPRPASAQVANGNIILLQVGLPSACAWPTGATFSNAMALCGTSSGLYYSTNGSTTFNPVAPAGGGVSSFNGRVGAVQLTKADVTATGLAATTTATTTASTTLQ
jgi:hypothetical protein